MDAPLCRLCGKRHYRNCEGVTPSRGSPRVETRQLPKEPPPKPVARRQTALERMAATRHPKAPTAAETPQPPPDNATTPPRAPLSAKTPHGSTLPLPPSPSAIAAPDSPAAPPSPPGSTDQPSLPPVNVTINTPVTPVTVTAKKPRGRPKTGNALTNAQKQAAYRRRQAAKKLRE